MEIGVRELREQLRHWLDAVESGHEITVTERGRPIARLIGARSPTPLQRLIAEGVVTPARRPRRASSTHRKVKAKGTVSDLVSRQRR